MAVSRGLIISLGVSALSCTLLFLYFRNKISTIERKVDVMFDLIQNHESERKPVMQYMPSQTETSSYDTQKDSMSNNRDVDLIDVSDDDFSDDSREVSDDEDDYYDNENSKISLNNTETIPLNDDDVKKIVVPLTVKNVNLEENPLQEITDSLDELDDDDDDDDDDYDDNGNNNNESVSLSQDVIEVVKSNSAENENNEQQTKDKDHDEYDEDADEDEDDGENDNEEDEDESEIDYSKLKVSELKSLAKEKGLTNYKSLKKAPLVELLKSSE